MKKTTIEYIASILLYIFCILLAGFFICRLSHAENVIHLEWDANTQPDLKEYRVDVGFEPGKVAYKTVVSKTYTSLILTDVNRSIWIGVKAFDNKGRPSDYSNIVNWIAPVEPCEGDFDGDGNVQYDDLMVFVSDYGKTNCENDCEGDFDGDNDVDYTDYSVFMADYGKTDCKKEGE